MGLWQAPTVTNDMDLKQLKNLVAMLIHDLDFVINGNISSKNVREIGGFQVGDNYLRSKNGLVGMSSAKLGGDLDDVRIWAGHSNPALAPFRVYNSGKAVLSNIEITGGSISWANVNSDPSIPVLPAYIKSTYIDETNVISPNITGGTITGSTIQTSVSSYPRVELSSTSNIFSAQASDWQKVEIYGKLNTSPTLSFEDATSSTNMFYFGDMFIIDHSGSGINLSTSGTVNIGGNQCRFTSWSHIYSYQNSQTLQQALNSLDARISALE